MSPPAEADAGRTAARLCDEQSGSGGAHGGAGSRKLPKVPGPLASVRNGAKRLPGPAQVFSFLAAGLLKEIEVKSGQLFLRVTDTGRLAIDNGSAAAGVDAPGQTCAVLLSGAQQVRRATARR